MKIPEILKNKTLWKQVAFLFGATILLVIISSWILGIYTRHGESVVMPKVTGKSLEQVKSELSTTHFELIVRDSVFDSKSPKHSIVSQDPIAGSKVKEHRKIYVTIVSMASKKVPMPNLGDVSLRQASQLLESNGFKVGPVIYQPSEYDNIIIEQRYKGRKILEGEMLEQGSVITLVVGKSGSESGSEGDEEETKN